MHLVVIAVYLCSNTQQHSNSSTHALDELLGNSLVSSERSLSTRLARNDLVGSSVRMLGNEESGKGDPVKPSDRRSNPVPDASSLNTYC